MSAPTDRKLVFLGPSLGIAEARGICPDAEFRPPVRFGDLYAVAGAPPGWILLIDGVFHGDTPVWQREILHLLRAGWTVLGASSMGALRALELAAYGMIGLGDVYEWYRSGRIEGDDEVALLHGVAEMGWLPLTLPLVDVRHALEDMQREGALTGLQAAGILLSFKRMGYEKRTLRALLALARALEADAEAVRARLSDPARGRKALDARLALRVLAGRAPLPEAAVRWPDPVPPPVEPETLLLRRIHPLTGPPMRVADALREMARRRPDALRRPRRESRRSWFLCDWVRVSESGPDAAERRAFAAWHSAALARELGIPPSRWRAASGLREDELSDRMAGLAIEAWLTRQAARGLGIDHSSHVDGTSLIPLALVDWMRRHGVEAPAGRRADAAGMASWLVEMGPAFFGAPDWHDDAALAGTLAANGDLARWRRAVGKGAESP